MSYSSGTYSPQINEFTVLPLRSSLGRLLPLHYGVDFNAAQTAMPVDRQQRSFQKAVSHANATYSVKSRTPSSGKSTPGLTSSSPSQSGQHQSRSSKPRSEHRSKTSAIQAPTGGLHSERRKPWTRGVTGQEAVPRKTTVTRTTSVAGEYPTLFFPRQISGLLPQMRRCGPLQTGLPS